MKRTHWLAPIFALGLLQLPSCQKEEQAPASTAPVAVEDEVKTEEELVVVPAMGPAERAKNYGIIKHLPKNTEALLSVYNISDMAKQFSESGLGAMVNKLMLDDDSSLDEVLGSDSFLEGMKFFGNEAFFAMGEGSSSQADILLKLGRAQNHVTGLSFPLMMKSALEDGYFSEDDGWLVYLSDHADELMELADKAQMPPMYFGVKIKDEQARLMAQGQMDQMMSMVPLMNEEAEVATVLNVKRLDQEFKGIRINGAELMKIAGDDMEESFSEGIGQENAKRLIESLKDNNLVYLYGFVDDYFIIYLGSDEEGFKLAEDLENSLAANPELNFLDAYTEKKPLSLVYVSNKMSGMMMNHYTGVGDMVDGFRSGVAQSGLFGDTQEMDVMLEATKTKEEAFYDGMKTTRSGLVFFTDDKGFHMEFYGGAVSKLMSTEKHRFGILENAKNVWLYIDGVSDPAGSKLLWDYLSTLGETAYVIAGKFAEIEIDEPEMDQFRQGLGMFDSLFKKDAVKIWTALRNDLGEGLGNEGALVSDWNGSMPQEIPNVPKSIIENGKIPRFVYVANVVDRAKLGASWTKIEEATASLTGTISQMVGKNLPTFKPKGSSPKEGLRSYTYPVPYFTENFEPSVSVSDDLFFLSTSMNYSESLSELLAQPQAKARTGSYMKVNFKELRKYGDFWLKFMDQYGEETLGEYGYGDFKENRPQLETILDGIESLGDMIFHVRLVNGEPRYSLHLSAK